AALWDRVNVVEFPLSIPKEKQNPQLRPLLQNPDIGGKAILTWAAQGLKRYREAQTLHKPACVIAWTGKHQKEQHPIVRWIDECIAFGDYWMSVEQLYTSYEAWCRDEDEDAMVKKEFSIFIKGLNGVSR